MILYHFTSAKHALNSVRENALKVSDFSNLNDPFELRYSGASDKRTRDYLAGYSASLSMQIRLLCCSKSWSSPVLWGHYADHHRGIALVLEVDSRSVHDVKYVKSRNILTKNNIKKENFDSLDPKSISLLTTKYIEWKYEDEARMFFDHSDMKRFGGLEFVDCNDFKIKIVGLILGPLNTTSNKDISRSIPYKKSIWYTKARLAFNSYKVVKDQRSVKVKVNSTLGSMHK